MKKSYLYGLGLVAIVLLSACVGKKPAERTPQELYALSVRDAAFADADEIYPLISLTPEDPLTKWDDQGRVLLVTWHNYPGSYPEGETVTLSWGTVWTFTEDEIASKYAKDISKVKDQELRLKQLIGFGPDSVHTTFTGFWVSPEDVVRPAYQTDPADGSMMVSFPEEETVEEAYKIWFDDNILNSYYYGAYPWTRLGYTFDWADNGTDYGLTEFLVSQGAEVEVAFTETTEEFLSRLAE
ncbi:MAG: hypothetical protein Q4C63_03575 [Eubacteriales bacterium]|nr:hypothetical protein [Eubacteriales bacterium]